MVRSFRMPFDWRWTLRTYLLIVCTLLALLVIADLGTVTTGGGWLAARGPLPPSVLSACVGELASADERIQLHARDVIARVAQQCPDAADLLVPYVAPFLRSRDVRVRAQTIEMLGTIGPAASPFVAEIEASRGTGMAHMDHVIDIAEAGIQRPLAELPLAGQYCSRLSRSAVEEALRSPARIGWSWPNVQDSECSTWPRSTQG